MLYVLFNSSVSQTANLVFWFKYKEGPKSAKRQVSPRVFEKVGNHGESSGRQDCVGLVVGTGHDVAQGSEGGSHDLKEKKCIDIWLG